MRYVESGSWYEGLYQDKAPVIPAARSFSCIHDGGARSCVLLVLTGVMTVEDMDVTINQSVADELGITIPESMQDYVK